MVVHEYLQEFGIHCVRAREPFDLTQLYELVTHEYSRGDADGIGQPVFFDLREIDVRRISQPDIRRHIMKKSVLDESVTDIVVAYLVDGLSSQAMVRMVNTYSELSGVSSEGKTFITESLREAVQYLAGAAALSETDMAMLEERLSPSVVTIFPRGSA
ncbi:MAG: hypothetical protein OQK05_11780 [Pseudopelagicola sp.]|nr:hypothetical protein [Pseudopelagicola sp.]